MPTIPTHSASDSAEHIANTLSDAGAVVVENICDEATRSTLVGELEAYVTSAEVTTTPNPADFYPGHTRRITALARRSETAGKLMLHPQVVSICDSLLLPNCERYQLHVGSALVIGPGAREQVLHREDDSYDFFEVPRPNLIIATMWAITDFTVDNGATLIVPGSHRWKADRKPEPDEVVSATMKKGDMLAWMGGTLHGAGANTSNEWRYGVFLSYSLGWLRQEENQYLDAPHTIAKDLPAPVRALLGYKMHDGLGFYDIGDL